jgi:hypothetical protein
VKFDGEVMEKQARSVWRIDVAATSVGSWGANADMGDYRHLRSERTYGASPRVAGRSSHSSKMRSLRYSTVGRASDFDGQMKMAAQ